ncbi:hypothetical protein RF11_04403 [Thelohanellus kitauei]|uniref:Uncharacterized protein n=1 Tax=Thelohanellus kitauei TaxID=669202 RepID=A0A0C2MGQ2_THEKT|nr:hypothetical protein RF11_04403 [Thelohanellus kitauei]
MSLKSETGQFIMNLKGAKNNQRSLLTCNVTESSTEVFFGGCFITFQNSDGSIIKEYEIKYLHIFRKDSNYNITNLYINFRPTNETLKYINILLNELLITSPRANRDCMLKSTELIRAKFNFFKEIYHCKQDDPLYISTYHYNYLSSQDRTDEIHEETMKKKGRFPVNNIVIIFFAFVTIATCITIIAYKNNASRTFEQVYQNESQNSYCNTYSVY